MNFYVNGVNVASAPGAAVDPQMSNNHEVSIGSRRSMVTEQNPDPAYDLSFVGLIDEVALYDHALSAADVEAHFAAAFVPIPEPSTLMMALVGLISLAGFARRRWR